MEKFSICDLYLAEKNLIEDVVKKATDNLLTMPEFEMEDKEEKCTKH